MASSYDVESSQAVESSQEAEAVEAAANRIEPASKKDKEDIRALVDKWDFNILDKNLGQKTLVTFDKKDKPNRAGWRLDSQSNKPFVKYPKEDPNTYYQNLAVQNSNGKKQVVYSCLVAPVAVQLGAQFFKDGFKTSLDNEKVAVVKRSGANWNIILED